MQQSHICQNTESGADLEFIDSVALSSSDPSATNRYRPCHQYQTRNRPMSRHWHYAKLPSRISPLRGCFIEYMGGAVLGHCPQQAAASAMNSVSGE